MDRAEQLGLGHAYVEGSAGLAKAWDAPLAAYARLEAGAHPAAGLDVFGFGELNTLGAFAGAGIRKSF